MVGYVDNLTADSTREVSRIFPVNQRSALELFSSLPALPSALLFERGEGRCWSVGRYAYEQQEYTPDRVVTSSKSWLCHGGVNREAKILPWGSREVPPEHLISPVDAATRILEQIRDSWNGEFARVDEAYRFENQRVVVTVPASFDADAQELTLRAARAVGITSLRLLEEPQAALYRWLEAHSDIPTSGRVLVCDVGGGTTDLSLFILSRDDQGLPVVSRIAVSDHILLGGDNIDAALGERLRSRFEEKVGREASHSERIVIRSVARRLKEQMLGSGENLPEHVHVSIPASGRSLFGGAISIEVNVAEERARILEGFFPICEARTEIHGSKFALREAGLPYARDPRVTAHVAAFLKANPVDYVLFNGGTLASPLTRSRILQCLTSWSGHDVTELETHELDNAVARGAAWFGYAAERERQRIILSGYPRTLYLELFKGKRTDAAQALCIIPKGFSDLEAVRVPVDNLTALIERPVRFQLWSSLDRTTDRMGDVVAIVDGSFNAIAPVATQLSLDETSARDGLKRVSSDRVPIDLYVSLSETGVCRIECRLVSDAQSSERPQSWELQFNVREQSHDVSSTGLSRIQAPEVQRCIEEIDALYGRRKSDEGTRSPKSLLKTLEGYARRARSEWDLPFMRALWPAIERGITRRARSLEHETAWFGVAGFCLRPGIGDPLDPIRIDEAWQLIKLGIAHPREKAARAAALIFWRRISGGLDSSRQNILFESMYPEIAKTPSYISEVVRTVASLERIDIDLKYRLFQQIVNGLGSRKIDTAAGTWALERLLLRSPILSEVDTVVPGDSAAGWISELDRIDERSLTPREWVRIYAAAVQATGDVRRDLPSGSREFALRKLRRFGASSDLLMQLEVPRPLSQVEVGAFLGDSLPAGIQLAR